MCKQFFGEDNLRLGVHHIIPRNEGGKNNFTNLIALCESKNGCHNIAEIEKLSKDAILSYYERIERRNVCTDLDWHKWVYGGYQKPY